MNGRFELRLALLWMALSFQSVSGADGNFWKGLTEAPEVLLDPLKDGSKWEQSDFHYYHSALSPGILLKIRSRQVHFFGDLQRYRIAAPSFFVIKTKAGTQAFSSGQSVSGDQLAASWIVTSFQGSRGWEQFDVPWFLSLQKRPSRITLGREGLRLEFPDADSGYIFSMPLFGYYKPPQEGNDFALKHDLPSKGIQPWTWKARMPASIVERCDWWSRVAKAYPIAFQESFRVSPSTDEITFRQDHRWKLIRDEWGTEPVRFAPLSPAVGLLWKHPGFPMKISVPIHDPDYFTGFGPLVGALESERLEIDMKVLQYVHEMEQLEEVPATPTRDQARALSLIREGMLAKFRSASGFQYDHAGPENLGWNLVGDVWYPRGLEFVDGRLKEQARASLRHYMVNDVLRPHFPHHGKFVLRGAGIGSFGAWGDAGKFMTNTLQPIWAYAQFTGDWPLIRERWDLIKRFFTNPEETYWLTYGRRAIAEMGDEAAPCSSYARLAWAVGDRTEYLSGVYQFARQLVHHYIKQRAAPYFYQHQPFNVYEPMPAENVYPTHVGGSTMGWNVDGPTWGFDRRNPHDHQSTNRWIRFHDPDVGRFYRDHLAVDVRQELDWYLRLVRENRQDVFQMENYRNALSGDRPHSMPSLARLRSFLLGESLQDLTKVAPLESFRVRRGGAIALGYSYLRSSVPVTHRRLVPKEIEPSPFVLGVQEKRLDDVLAMVQFIVADGFAVEPIWRGWSPPGGSRRDTNSQFRSFGTIGGDFGGRVAGPEGSQWISYGTQVHWASAIPRRRLEAPEAILREQDQTPLYVIGPFSNSNDAEVTRVSYPPETEISFQASYQGIFGRVGWKAARLSENRTLDLKPLLFQSNQSVHNTLAYALQFVWSDEETPAYLLVGHVGGVQAWLNEDLAIDHHGIHHRRLQPDAVRGLVTLKKGWNRILVKTEGFGENLVVQFRLVHLDRQPIPGLRFSGQPKETPAS